MQERIKLQSKNLKRKDKLGDKAQQNDPTELQLKTIESCRMEWTELGYEAIRNLF